MDILRFIWDGLLALADLGDETRSPLVGRAVNPWAKMIETREMVVVASASSVTELNMAVRRTVFVESLRRTERSQRCSGASLGAENIQDALPAVTDMVSGFSSQFPSAHTEDAVS